MSWVLRARGPGGQATLTGLDATTTVSALKDLIAERVGVPAARQELLGGFPPKPLQVCVVDAGGGSAACVFLHARPRMHAYDAKMQVAYLALYVSTQTCTQTNTA